MAEHHSHPLDSANMPAAASPGQLDFYGPAIHGPNAQQAFVRNEEPGHLRYVENSEAIQGAGAQQAFAQGGEAEYMRYVLHHYNSDNSGKEIAIPDRTSKQLVVRDTIAQAPTATEQKPTSTIPTGAGVGAENASAQSSKTTETTGEDTPPAFNEKASSAHQESRNDTYKGLYDALNNPNASPEEVEFARQALTRLEQKNGEPYQAYKEYAKARQDEAKSDQDYAEAHRLNERFDREWLPVLGALEVASERYSEMSARQRGSHYGRLAQGNNFAGLRRLLNRTHFIHNRRSAEADRITEEARQDFVTQLNRYSELYGLRRGTTVLSPRQRRPGVRNEYGDDNPTANRVINMRLQMMDMLEDRILGWQQNLTQTGRDIYGYENRALTRKDRFGNWIARQWQSSGRAGKIFKVALPAAVVGLGVGVGTAVAGAPVLATVGLGLGATYAGRKIGHGMAGAASRRMILTEEGATRARTMAAERRMSFIDNDDFNRNFPGNSANPNQLDITTPIEDGTTAAVRENLRRRRIAGAVGAGAAALGVAAGAGAVDLGVHLLGGDHVAMGHGAHAAHAGTHHAKAHEHPKTRHHAASGHTSLPNPHQYEWTVAHELDPGHEWTTIHHALTGYNETFGTSYHLAPQPNGTIQVVNGFGAHAHFLNESQQTALNSYMESQTVATDFVKELAGTL